MVSGGTGFQIIAVGDPVVYNAGEGLVLNVSASLVPGTDWAQLRVDGEAARRPEFERQTTARQSDAVEIQKDAPPGEQAVQKGDLLELDLPEEDSDRWEHFVTVPLGRPVFLNALPDAERGGKSRVLLGAVHEQVHDLIEGEQPVGNLQLPGIHITGDLIAKHRLPPAPFTVPVILTMQIQQDDVGLGHGLDRALNEIGHGPGLA